MKIDDGRRAERTIEDFREFLRSSGLKMTSRRMTVIDRLLAMKGHHSADDIVDMLHKEGVNVSKATVYRLLALLKQSGCFNEHDFGIGRKFYEFSRGREHHDHLYCVRCGTVSEFHSDEIEALQRKISRRFRFKPLYHSHYIFGYCANCLGVAEKES